MVRYLPAQSHDEWYKITMPEIESSIPKKFETKFACFGAIAYLKIENAFDVLVIHLNNGDVTRICPY